jgi:hypothetical protein
VQPAASVDAPEGFAHRLHEKAISLTSMDRRLRWLTVLAIAQIAVVALMILVRDVPWPSVGLGEDPLAHEEASIPVPVLVVVMVELVLAWSYVLAGALHAHGLLRFGMLLVYSIGMLLLVAATAEGNGTLIVLGGLLAAWVVTPVLWLRDRRHLKRRVERHHRHRLKLPTFLFCVLITAAIYLSAPLSGARPDDLGGVIGIQLVGLELLIAPVLFLAGSDFAEWGEVLAGRVAHVAGRLARDRGLAALAGLAAVLVLVEVVVAAGPRGVGVSVLAMLPSLLLTAAFGAFAIRRHAHPQVPFWPVVLAALLQLAWVYTLAFAANGRGAQDPEAFRDPVVVTGIMRDLAPWAMGIALLVLGGAGLLIQRGGRVASSGLYVAAVACAFLELGPDTWVRGLLGVAISDASIPQPSVSGVQVTVALATLAVAVLVARGGSRLATPLRLLLTLLVATQVIRWLFDLYTGAIELSGHFTIAQAVVLVLAMCWDVAMSGETVTNVHGHHVPRHSRVLLYFGYTILVATTVLYFTSRHALESGHRLHSLIENDTWPQYGLLFLGLPLLLTFFFLNLGAWRRRLLAREVETVDRSELADG